MTRDVIIYITIGVVAAGVARLLLPDPWATFTRVWRYRRSDRPAECCFGEHWVWNVHEIRWIVWHEDRDNDPIVACAAHAGDEIPDGYEFVEVHPARRLTASEVDDIRWRTCLVRDRIAARRARREKALRLLGAR